MKRIMVVNPKYTSFVSIVNDDSSLSVAVELNANGQNNIAAATGVITFSNGGYLIKNIKININTNTALSTAAAIILCGSIMNAYAGIHPRPYSFCLETLTDIALNSPSVMPLIATALYIVKTYSSNKHHIDPSKYADILYRIYVAASELRGGNESVDNDLFEVVAESIKSAV